MNGLALDNLTPAHIDYLDVLIVVFNAEKVVS